MRSVHASFLVAPKSARKRMLSPPHHVIMRLCISTFLRQGENWKVGDWYFTIVRKAHYYAHYPYRTGEYQKLSSNGGGFSTRHYRHQWSQRGGEDYAC